MRKKRPACLAGGDAAGRKDQHKFTVRQRRLPHTDKGSYGLRSYLPASALFTAVKPVTSSAVTDIDCRARIFPFPQIRANSVNSPESVFCLNRLALQSIRLSCRGKYVFSAWFGPDGAVPHLTFSLFQRQNAPAGSKERIFCLPFSERRPLPSGPGHEAFPATREPRSSATADGGKGRDLRHRRLPCGAIFLLPAESPPTQRTGSMRSRFPAPRLREPERLWRKTNMPP